MNSQLENTISRLISLNKEGDYWDFKESLHVKNVDLIHDIICLANNPYHKGPRFIIYGITENRDVDRFEIIGLDPEKKLIQSNIINVLRNANFSNDNIPDITTEELEFEEKRIAVLIIRDCPESRPYRLDKQFGKDRLILRAGSIYTRIGDTNTPKDRTASPIDTEKMWRQHFGYDKPPIERLLDLLKKPHEWTYNPANKYLPQGKELISHSNFPVYNREFPEFQVELSDFEERAGEDYSYFCVDNKGYYGTAYFKYNGITLFTLEYVYIDGMRELIPIPEIYNLFKQTIVDNNCIYYLVFNSYKGMFFKFINIRDPLVYSRTNKLPILLFNNNEELDDFVKYSQENKEDIFKIIPDVRICEIHLKRENAGLRTRLEFLDRINQFHRKWKKSHL